RALSHHHLHSFPTRRSSDLFVPGMGTRSWPWARTQARANCAGVEPFLLASSFTASASLRLASNAFSRKRGFVRRQSRASKNSRRSEEHTSELQSHLNLVCRL